MVFVTELASLRDIFWGLDSEWSGLVTASVEGAVQEFSFLWDLDLENFYWKLNPDNLMLYNTERKEGITTTLPQLKFQPALAPQ